MKEFVTANGTTYECKNVTTGLNSITMTMDGYTANDLMAAFADVSELTVAFEGEEEPHGTYKNLKLESVTTNADDYSVSVTMHIKSEIERRLDALEESQEIQDGAIMELAQSVGGEA